MEQEKVSSLAPSLWNPSAIGNWSLLLTPIFGAYLTAENWKAMDQPVRAKGAMYWQYAGIAILFLIFINMGIAIGTYVIYLVAWSVKENRGQRKTIMTTYGPNYPRRSWGKVLAIGIVGMLIWQIIVSIFNVPGGGKGLDRALDSDESCLTAFEEMKDANPREFEAIRKNDRLRKKYPAYDLSQPREYTEFTTVIPSVCGAMGLIVVGAAAGHNVDLSNKSIRELWIWQLEQSIDDATKQIADSKKALRETTGLDSYYNGQVSDATEKLNMAQEAYLVFAGKSYGSTQEVKPTEPRNEVASTRPQSTPDVPVSPQQPPAPPAAAPVPVPVPEHGSADKASSPPGPALILSGKVNLCPPPLEDSYCLFRSSNDVIVIGYGPDMEGSAVADRLAPAFGTEKIVDIAGTVAIKNGSRHFEQISRIDLR